MSYRKHPPAFTLLYAVAVPRGGGDTQFASLYRLYETLEPAAREHWASLEVEHVARSSYFDDSSDRRSVHPLLRRHPENGRPVVFASPAYARKVLGLSDADSERLLHRLATAIDPPDVIHRWQANDLLVWDNRAVVHRATDHDPGEIRNMWRVAVNPGNDEL
jgi:taurine dioxygenase